MREDGGLLRHALLASLVLLSACATTHAATPHPTAEQAAPSTAAAAPEAGAPKWGLVIHGGAGNIAPEMLAPEKQAEYRAVLAQAQCVGRTGTHLRAGGR